jgi:hypothetical protein
MKSPVESMVICGPKETLARLKSVDSDLGAVSHLGDQPITYVPSDAPLTVEVQLLDLK